MKNDIVYHTIMLTPKQEKNLLASAKKLGCINVIELLNKSIELANFLAETAADGFEMYAVNPKKSKIYKKEKQVMLLAEDKEAIISVNNHINEILKLNKQVRATNAFGAPIDENLA